MTWFKYFSPSFSTEGLNMKDDKSSQIIFKNYLQQVNALKNKRKPLTWQTTM